MVEFVRLDEAVDQHIRAGDTVHVIAGHSRWTALMWELVRQHWHRPSELTLVMSSLSSLGTMLVRAGCVKKIVTTYAGDSFPKYTPNPVYQRAFRDGSVEVENWSFLTFVQRLRAAADGVPAAVTGSVRGSSMAGNNGYFEVDTEVGVLSMVSSLTPDIALMHAAAADREGNLAVAPPHMEGFAGALAAKRGVLASVERVVDDLRPWSHLVRVPGHLVRAVAEVPFGAHPGGLYVGGGGPGSLPVQPYGEDLEFWIESRQASRTERFDEWIREWCLDLPSHNDYLAKLGTKRLSNLVARADPESWRADAEATEVSTAPGVTPAERAAFLLAQVLTTRIAELKADAVLAGAGLANLAAWVGTASAREQGSQVALGAEMGMWNYTPTPADPYVFNFRSFPSAAMLSDTAEILGTFIAGPRTRSIACVGAAQIDRFGNLNSTEIPGGPYLVGSGGANDAVTNAHEALVVSELGKNTLVDHCGYVTSPGERVRAVATDRGLLTKYEGELILTHVSAGPGSLDERVRTTKDFCGWDLQISPHLAELPPVSAVDVMPLRSFDPRGIFLGRAGST
jgi:acyl CoA:acetate/3-ketoacid CoA transferase alpha subunit/acyl CoA:acetate/3-ketoacid CoA transferase beta subunit